MHDDENRAMAVVHALAHWREARVAITQTHYMHDESQAMVVMQYALAHHQRKIGYRRHVHAPVKRKQHVHSAASFLPHVLSILTVVELDARSKLDNI